jgi:hypothetical protein
MNKQYLMIGAAVVGLMLFMQSKKAKAGTAGALPKMGAPKSKPIENKNINGELMRSIFGAGWEAIRPKYDAKVGIIQDEKNQGIYVDHMEKMREEIGLPPEVDLPVFDWEHLTVEDLG